MSLQKEDSFNGYNPFPVKTWHDSLISKNCTIHFVYCFILDNDGVNNIFNFDPYIIDNNGTKCYYQRGYCWNISEKQNFIESIYNGMNCGSVILRLNNENKFKETKFEYDVVDGKQRLSTLISFFNNEFADKAGHYWKDFSKFARRKFLYSNCIGFFEFQENTPDADIKQAFLNVNFTGVPLSKEHLEYVKSINI